MATTVPPSADLLDPVAPAPTVVVATVREKDTTDALTSHILLWSFVAAVLLAVAGFAVVATYLFHYLDHAVASFSPATMDQLSKMDPGAMQSIIIARSGLWKFILQSCGVIAGVAFGFLGFALFLLGAKGDMDAAFDDSQHKVQLSRMAPGSFVILIAAVLIGICCYQRVTVTLPTTTREVTPNAVAPDAPMPDTDNLPAPDLPAPSAAKPRPAKPAASKKPSQPQQPEK